MHDGSKYSHASCLMNTRYNQYGGEGQRAVGGVEAGPPLQTLLLDHTIRFRQHLASFTDCVVVLLRKWLLVITIIIENTRSSLRSLSLDASAEMAAGVRWRRTRSYLDKAEVLPQDLPRRLQLHAQGILGIYF